MCKYFPVEGEMKNGKHRAYNFAIDTLDPKYLLEKSVVVFDSLNFAAKLNIALSFEPKNLDGSCR